MGKTHLASLTPGQNAANGKMRIDHWIWLMEANGNWCKCVVELWGMRFCKPKELSGDATAAGLRTILQEVTVSEGVEGLALDRSQGRKGRGGACKC